MTNATLYFDLARSEEKAGNECAALLFYLSSFCDSFNSVTQDYPYGTVEKIRMLQNRLSLPDQFLFGLIHSYGPLSDSECQELLSDSIGVTIAGIKATPTGCANID
mgnify:CR=1 FL=1